MCPRSIVPTYFVRESKRQVQNEMRTRLIEALLLSSLFFFDFGFLRWFRTFFRPLLIEVSLYTQSAVLYNVIGLTFSDR